MRILTMIMKLLMPRTTRLLEADKIEDAVRAARFSQQREECQAALKRLEEREPSVDRVSETFLVLPNGDHDEGAEPTKGT